MQLDKEMQPIIEAYAYLILLTEDNSKVLLCLRAGEDVWELPWGDMDQELASVAITTMAAKEFGLSLDANLLEFMSFRQEVRKESKAHFIYAAFGYQTSDYVPAVLASDSSYAKSEYFSITEAVALLPSGERALLEACLQGITYTSN